MKKERRLLIAAEIFPPSIGGPATYAATLARELPKRGWKVAVIFYGDTVAGEYAATIYPVARRGGSILRYWRYFRTLWRLAKDFPTVYAQGPVSSGLPALLVAKLRRKKLVVKVTGDYAWEQAFRAGATQQFIEEFQQQRATGKYTVLRMVERLVCRRADLVIAPSQFLQKIVTGWGVSAEKIAVILNAVSFPVKTGERLQLRERFGLKSDELVVVSVGRAVPWKGFGVLGRAVAELQATGRNLRLVCIGVTDIELRAMMEQAGAQLFAVGDQRISGIGVIDQDQLLDWLRAADCFVLNSAYEGYSHIILEAMYAGVPVITTDVGGNRELVIHKQTGLLVPYNNIEKLKAAIIELADNPDLAQRLGVELAQKIQPSTFYLMLESTEGFFENL